MAQELIIRLRDDVDGELGEDIQTHEYTWKGVSYEIDLRPVNFDSFDSDIQKWIARSRPVKKKRRSPKKSKPGVSIDFAKPEGPWSKLINSWATERGYDWGDKAQRDAVRQWAAASGYPAPRTGIIPRETMEAFHEATTTTT
jgi:Lsr2